MGLECQQNRFGSFAMPPRPEKNKTPSLRQPLFPRQIPLRVLPNKRYLSVLLSSHLAHVLQPLDVGVFSPLCRYRSQEVDDWTASQPLYTSLLNRGVSFPCMRVERGGVTTHNIQATWSKCGIHPFDKTHHAETPLTEVEKPSTTLPKVEGEHAQIKALTCVAIGITHRFQATAQEEPHQALYPRKSSNE